MYICVSLVITNTYNIYTFLQYFFTMFFVECNKQTEKKIFHMRCLIEGAIYKEQGDKYMASQVNMCY